MLKNFQKAYNPSRELSVDESMIGFKGRLSFIQYLPKKPTKWGMKAFVLADSKNRYTYNWRLYTGEYNYLYTHYKYKHQRVHIYIMYYYQCLIGKDDSLDTSSIGVTHAIVLKLLEGLEDRGHHVYTDNYYSSPALFGDLRRLGFGACGTVRLNRQGLPKEVKATLKKGETVSKQMDSSMLALKWMDKRAVTMLSTIHDDSFVTKKRRSRTAQDGQEDILKPLMV